MSNQQAQELTEEEAGALAETAAEYRVGAGQVVVPTLVEDLVLIDAEIDAEERRHAAEMAGLKAARRDTVRQRQAASVAGLTTEQVKRAEELVRVSGRAVGEWRGAVEDAIRDVATGPTGLRRRCFGVKDYDRWRGQREDHEYGMQPQHGALVFRIGLTTEARKLGWNDAERDVVCRYIAARAALILCIRPV